jgi:hypothetical protein
VCFDINWLFFCLCAGEVLLDDLEKEDYVLEAADIHPTAGQEGLLQVWVCVRACRGWVGGCVCVCVFVCLCVCLCVCVCVWY